MLDFGTKTDNSPPPGGQLSAAEFNNYINELENSVTRSGQALNGASVVQLATSLFLHSVKSQAFQDSGVANAYVATPVSGLNGVLLPDSYSEMNGSKISFIASNTNSGNTTLDIGQTTGTLLGTKKVLTLAGAEIPSATIASGMFIEVQYNSSLDGGAGAWVVVNTSAQLLDSTRIDVASIATVNLTSSAPNTRNINITGVNTITAFTVAAGKLYFVRFDSSLTLTNNASIITQRGANIVTAAGDTCIIRATAANVVEVLCYTRAIPQALGEGQTLQIVTGSRALNTNYTNTTGRSIFVTVRATTTGPSIAANRIGIQLDAGAEYYSEGTPGAGAGYILCAVGIIPAGAVYRANINNATLTDWTEMRT